MSAPFARTLPIACPKCHRQGAQVEVLGVSIATLKCVTCEHAWALELRALPLKVREQVVATRRAS